MAKSKGKAKKAAPKGKPAKAVAKKSKPVVKKAAKKTAKKAVTKAKKVSKPLTKPTVKKKPIVKGKSAKKEVKSKVKPVKKVAVKANPVKPTKAVKPQTKSAVKTKSKVVTQKRVEAAPPEKKQLYITTAKPQVKKAAAKRPVLRDINMRYSDDELKEFKQLIDKKLDTAREELKYLKEALENHNDNQAGSKAWNMEEGSDTSEMETLMNQIARQHQYIRNLELALVRIENKTYGICRLTGKLIPKERLRIVPHATLSLEAKMSRKAEDVMPADAAAVTPPTDFAEGFED